MKLSKKQLDTLIESIKRLSNKCHINKDHEVKRKRELRRLKKLLVDNL